MHLFSQKRGLFSKLCRTANPFATAVRFPDTKILDLAAL